MGFFDDRSKIAAGSFFANMPGRGTGDFHKKASESPSPSPSDGSSGTSQNASPQQMATTPSPTPNPGQGAAAGGLYGTGQGCAPGTKKVAGSSPSDLDYIFPTGFHRPTKDQPEALEAGAERFHTTDAPGPDFGTGQGISQGGTRDNTFTTSTLSGQMGKHADPGQFLKDRANDVANSVGSGANEIGSMAGSAIESATKSPLLMTLGAGLLARKGVKGAVGAIKKVKANRVARAAEHVGAAAGAAKKVGVIGETAQKIQRFLRR